MKNKKSIFVLIALILVVIAGILFFQKDAEDVKEPDPKPSKTEVAQEEEEQPEADAERDTDGDADTESDKDAEQSNAAEEPTYEERLAAGTITAISLAYPDFELTQILTETQTELDAAADSAGVYVEFVSGGEPMVIHAKWLEKERTKAGTVDLHEQTLGFATFDVVNGESLEGKDMKTLDISSLSGLIAEAMLVSLYEHY